MKRKIWKILMLSFAASTFSISSASASGVPHPMTSEELQNAEDANVVEAKIVTEVLEWGETVTGVRIEYDDEIWSGAIRNDRYFETYGTSDVREIAYIYVNNSGKPHEFEAYGKYVFIQFEELTGDASKYLEAVTFNESSSSREKLQTINVWQNHDIQTRNGKIARVHSDSLPFGGAVISASEEMRVDIDNFTAYPFAKTENYEFGYYLYVPEGYEKKAEDLESLPLMVHFPSGDYACTDYTGAYSGALYRHPDATVWASDSVQEEHPCFVVTIWADKYFKADEQDKVSEMYVEIVDKLIEEYNIDKSRIYGCSIGGGGGNLYRTALRNPDMFAGFLMAGFDPFYCENWIYGDNDVTRTTENVKMLAEEMNIWFFAGVYDPHGTASDPEELNRGTGLRLIDYGKKWVDEGIPFDYGFGEDGELMWNALLKGSDAEAEALEQITRAEEAGKNDMITLYLPNTILSDPHWSWSHAFMNPGVQDWIFEQVNETPYSAK